MKLRVRFLISGWQKSRGFIGRRSLTPIYFETRFGIHTFGMKKPIDVIILNKKSRIVKLKRSLKPGKLFFWNPKFYRVIELSSDNKYKFSLGDRVSLISDRK